MELKPQSVFECFERVCQVPHPSKKEEKMIDFLADFGRSLGLPTRVDETGNVIITKPATIGMEDKPIVVLQSHMDMVCEKRGDVEHNFLTDPIKTVVEDGWMHACGTTLGADDGIGVAMEMALLQANDVEHGPIECVFTRDEETGLTGAEGMQGDFMQGRLLINLDSEDEGQIFVSCAGGARTNIDFDYQPVALPAGLFGIKLHISGLMGGHSGDDIDKGRANANKLLARFIYTWGESHEWHLIDVQAGGLHNAIPREATCVIAVKAADKEAVRVAWNVFAAQVEDEFGAVEKTMCFDLESTELGSEMVPDATSHPLFAALMAVHNGVKAMCQGIDLVETSSNLASVRITAPGHITVCTSQRSSVASARDAMCAQIRAAFSLAGGVCDTGEGYPGWKMNPNSRLLKVAVDEYVKLFGQQPIVRGIHAGLECGLFSEKFPGMDMVSFGPTLRGVHSPDERLEIATVDKVWRHLLAILKNI